jgi:putative Holliday junction resolvase
VGLPLNLDGSDGDAALRARRFAARLQELTAVEVVLWDERLSSQQAARALGDAGVRARKRRGLTDRVAAALVLQSYLDARTAERPTS